MTEFLQIIQIILFFIACGLIYKYLPSYLTQKGKNLATKEDIGKITHIVEDVRSSFMKETEKLKANLQLLMNTKQSLFTEERQALIDFHEKYYTWFGLCTDITFGQSDLYKTEELESYYGKIQESYFQLCLSEAKLVLFVDNEQLIQSKDQLKMKTLGTLPPIVLRYKTLLAENNLELKKASMKPPPTRDVETPTIFKQRGAFTETIVTELLKAMSVINPLHKEFQKESRGYLYKLIAEGGTERSVEETK